jgi:hypothetical protein
VGLEDEEEDGMKELMKIEHLRFGAGGYDDAMFGFSFTLTGDGSGCGDFWGCWAKDIGEHFGGVAERVKELMKAAKVDEFYQLKGKPVEVIFNGGRLESWRILTEVL